MLRREVNLFLGKVKTLSLSWDYPFKWETRQESVNNIDASTVKNFSAEEALCIVQYNAR